MAAAASQHSASVLPFPRADLRALLGGALKRHRLPETLAAQLLHEAQKFPDVSADAALAFALDQRIVRAPLDLGQARAILLVGPAGAGKSAVAGKIVHAARAAGRRTNLTRADGGLALLRTGAQPSGLLTVMEADGFNPLNARAASAFSALGDIAGVETIGVLSALSDAEDVADMVGTFRFRRIIVTNMDRTRRLGALLAAVTGGAALVHVTRGPRPEEALESLSPGALAALLLDTRTH